MGGLSLSVLDPLWIFLPTRVTQDLLLSRGQKNRTNNEGRTRILSGHPRDTTLVSTRRPSCKCNATGGGGIQQRLQITNFKGLG